METTSKLPNLPEFLSNESRYIQELQNPEVWRSVPLINYTSTHELENLSIVRFRGMIQDMFDPEFYLEQYEVSSTAGSCRFQNGKYRDCLVLGPTEKVNLECRSNVHADRRTIFIVSLPAINQWASTFEEENNCSKQNAPPVSHLPPSMESTKRSATDENDHGYEANKRQCIEDSHMNSNSSTSSSPLSMKYLVNSPIPERPSKACMVKLYSDFDKYPLNSIVDVVGFLSIDPAMTCSLTDPFYKEFENLSEIQAQNPPPSLIPRVHAVAVKILEHNNPLLDPLICEPIPVNISFENVHKDLKILLTQCFLGDELAAEYLLAHLISTVYSRSELYNIGKFALNICNFPREALPSYTKDLYNILELFMPASHYLPMALETMNKIKYFPKKNYETNKIISGILQLAPQTHLVLDETRLQPGILEPNGVQGVQNLAHLIKSQQIKCDFQYYDLDFNVDIPVLVLSEGISMLPNDFLVPLNVNPDCVNLIEETLKAAKHYAQPKLDAIRRYLTYAKKSTFVINRTESELIENDFVEMRKRNPTTGADELQSLLVLSRLLAIGSGKSILDRECWEYAKKMEELRKVRVKNMPKAKN